MISNQHEQTAIATPLGGRWTPTFTLPQPSTASSGRNELLIERLVLRHLVYKVTPRRAFFIHGELFTTLCSARRVIESPLKRLVGEVDWNP
ncbi:unnamed protein product [Danaus chrysippus]|uniref:(African queen) hypothetical protein n=1 Tax=Danaus chrysippus TaxID=151541 RepID=A0A8J2QSH0_9NEOP|nr:unnamed protein product [Danaus chrysippus]